METRTVHVPKDCHEFLQRVAQKNYRTVPAQLRVILEDLKKNTEKLDTKGQ